MPTGTAMHMQIRLIYMSSLSHLCPALFDACRAIQILSRRSKNNPVLIGEPGVGKTAVAEGLAQVRVDPDSPVWLYIGVIHTHLPHVYFLPQLSSPVLTLTT